MNMEANNNVMKAKRERKDLSGFRRGRNQFAVMCDVYDATIAAIMNKLWQIYSWQVKRLV